MKITTNAHLLNSLTSLIDPNQRQQQDLQSQQELRQQKEKQTKAQAQELARATDRQGRIDANRIALKNLQDKLKADNLEKLKADFAVDNLDQQDQAAAPNLNLRESLGTGRKPLDTRPGQIIDIKV